MYTEYYLMQLHSWDIMITFNSNSNTQGYLLTTENLSSCCAALVGVFSEQHIMPSQTEISEPCLTLKVTAACPFANFLFSDFVSPTVSLSASQDCYF